VKQHLAAVVPQRLWRTLAAFALLLAASASAAQARQGPLPTGPRRDPEADRIRDEQRREMQLRKMSEAAERPPDEREVRAAVKQLGQDFQRIQVIRNEVARSLVGGASLDYAHVSEQAAEVRKRALRMQSYLALRADAGDAGRRAEVAADFGDGRLKEALVRLCKRIDSFVANPRFTSPGVLDVEGNARAGRDLQEIISLSNAVREGAARLRREGSAATHTDH
jgi:hypothetical protein